MRTLVLWEHAAAHAQAVESRAKWARRMRSETVSPAASGNNQHAIIAFR
jgi:hypothetical protein